MKIIWSWLRVFTLLGFLGMHGSTQLYAGLPKCYGVSNETNKMWFMVPHPGATPLPKAQEIRIAKTYEAEGSAYRASNKKMYLFDCASDNTGPCDLVEYTVNIASGTSTHTIVKTNIIPSGDRSVEGATFFIDDVNGQEFLFAAAGEGSSGDNSGQIYKWDTANWNLQTGYPLDISGDVGAITGLAYDPITDKYYGSKDYASSGGRNNNADIYDINLITGVTTFAQELSFATDSGGLTYAADGLLYTEDEGPRRIYTIDISNGAIVEAASFDRTNGDVASLACNAGERTDMGDLPDSYGYAAHTLPVFTGILNPMYLGTVPGDDDFGTANNGLKANGDDLDDVNNDDDGVKFKGRSIVDMAVLPGTTYPLTITTHGNGHLSAWFDWNKDGNFDDAKEQVAADIDGSSGSITLNVTVPTGTANGVLYSRFRYSSDTGLSANDDVSHGVWASDGEVEDYRLFVNPKIKVLKTSTADHTLVQPGDTIAYNINVKNPDSLITLHNITVTDPVPAGTTYVQGSAKISYWEEPSGYYRDSISSNQAYNESHGTLDWSANAWHEIGEGSTGQSPITGDIQIIADPRVSGVYAIRLKDKNRGIERVADLSAYMIATLQLDYRRENGAHSNGVVYIQVTPDSDANFRTLATITVNDDDPTYIHLEYDISAEITSTTRIRLISDGTLNNNDSVYFDNIQIDASKREHKTKAVHDPLNLTTAVDAYDIQPGDDMNVIFSVTVNDPMAFSRRTINNIAAVTAEEIVIPIRSSVSNPVALGSFGDLVFDDRNIEGTQDAGDTGLDGVKIYIDLNNNRIFDAGEPSKITSGGGFYRFSNVPFGDYNVSVVALSVPAEYSATTQDMLSVTVSGTVDNSIDFGFRAPRTLTGHLYNDLNGNGIQDGNETGLANISVTVTEANGTVHTVSTGADGNYSVTVLGRGKASVDIDEKDPDFPVGANQTEGTDPTNVTISSGAHSEENNGFNVPGSLTGHIYDDDNGDSIQQSNENNLSSITITVTDANGTLHTVKTGSDGNYTVKADPVYLREPIPSPRQM